MNQTISYTIIDVASSAVNIATTMAAMAFTLLSMWTLLISYVNFLDKSLFSHLNLNSSF